MTPTSTTESATITASGGAAVATGLGVVTMALFPLSIPFLLLTAAFVAPIVIVGLVAALPLAIVAGVVVAIRALRRSLAAGGEQRQSMEQRQSSPSGRLASREAA